MIRNRGRNFDHLWKNPEDFDAGPRNVSTGDL
jgi:hypothetical protein